MSSISLFAGSYERTVFGYTFNPSPPSFKVDFVHPAHLGSVKSVAVCGKFFLSGSSDDTIRIYNRLRKQEFGWISQHQGTVTCLKGGGAESKNVVSGAEDGTICIWSSRDWESIIQFKCKKSVIDLDIHPSNKVILSSSADLAVRLWDVDSGKCIHKRLHKKSVAPEKIMWLHNGQQYATSSHSSVFIYSTENRHPVHEFRLSKAVNAICALPNDKIAVGGEDMIVSIFDLNNPEAPPQQLTAHKSRVKALCFIENILFSADSNGVLAAHNVEEVKTLAVTLTNARITCLCGISNSPPTPSASSAAAAAVETTKATKRQRVNINHNDENDENEDESHHQEETIEMRNGEDENNGEKKKKKKSAVSAAAAGEGEQLKKKKKTATTTETAAAASGDDGKILKKKKKIQGSDLPLKKKNKKPSPQ